MLKINHPVWSALISVLLVAQFVSVTEAGDGSNPIKKGDPSPYSVELYKPPIGYEDLVKGYRRQWAHVSAIDFSALHWNHFVTIFINQDAQVYRNNFREYLVYEQMEEDEEEYEPNYQFYQRGTVFIKEHYVSDSGKPGNPTFLSIMVKRDEGYDPEYGDWQYLQSDTEGRIIFDGNSKNEGVMKACIECHNNMAERDFIFALNYKDTSSIPQGR